MACVDFTNAFPSTDQPTLWLKLFRMGMGGAIVDWHRMLYARMSYYVPHGDTKSAEFKAFIGPLTGDPTSPGQSSGQNQSMSMPQMGTVRAPPGSHGSKNISVHLPITLFLRKHSHGNWKQGAICPAPCFWPVRRGQVRQVHYIVLVFRFILDIPTQDYLYQIGSNTARWNGGRDNKALGIRL